MIVRVPPSLSRWGRCSLGLALSGLLYASCTTAEDTEPYVPAVSGATQPDPDDDLIDEDEACDRLRSAAEDAYDRLRCPEPAFPDCPSFLRPGGGSGCYEYSAGSVEACEEAYEEASSCRTLAPCVATAVLNAELPSCEQVVVPGAGGAGNAGGAGPELGGAGGQAPTGQGGQVGAGAPAGGNAAGGADGGAAN